MQQVGQAGTERAGTRRKLSTTTEMEHKIVTAIDSDHFDGLAHKGPKALASIRLGMQNIVGSKNFVDWVLSGAGGGARSQQKLRAGRTRWSSDVQLISVSCVGPGCRAHRPPWVNWSRQNSGIKSYRGVGSRCSRWVVPRTPIMGMVVPTSTLASCCIQPGSMPPPGAGRE